MDACAAARLFRWSVRLAGVAVALALLAATARADPIAWDVPVQIDPGSAAPLSAISCPSAQLCLAVDGSGDLVSSSNPTGGAGDLDDRGHRRHQPRAQRPDRDLVPDELVLRRGRPDGQCADHHHAGHGHGPVVGGEHHGEPAERDLLPLNVALRCRGRVRQRLDLHQPAGRRRHVVKRHRRLHQHADRRVVSVGGAVRGGRRWRLGAQLHQPDRRRRRVGERGRRRAVVAQRSLLCLGEPVRRRR